MYFVILRSQYILDSKNVYLLRSIIKNNKEIYIYTYTVITYITRDPIDKTPILNKQQKYQKHIK